MKCYKSQIPYMENLYFTCAVICLKVALLVIFLRMDATPDFVYAGF